jgi:TolA-binding protein
MSLALAAQQPGAIQGTITNKAGKPIAGAKVTLVRVGTTVTKEIKSKDNGTYFLAGLEPREFEITVQAEGYVSTKLIDRIITGGVLAKNITLLTAEENINANPNAKNDPGNVGPTEFNLASPLYSSQNFVEALPHLEKSFGAYQELIAKTKDEKEKATLETTMMTVKRIYGVTLFEVGNTDELRKSELWTKSETLLQEVFPLVPESNLQALLPITKALHTMASEKKDEAAMGKYQAVLDKIEPPNPAKDYNKAVESFNAGKLSEAKNYLDRTLEKSPNYALAHYLLGMVEYSNGNLKATKTCFLKYLELEPNGDKAGDVKLMLDDPSLKKIK